MTKCKDCVFFRPNDYDDENTYGYCAIELPPWMNLRVDRNRNVDSHPTWGDGCDLGQPE